MEDKIAAWLAYQPRTRIVFVTAKSPRIPFVDFGYEFAQAIKSKLSSRMLPMEAAQSARNIFKSHIRHNEVIGNFVAIENWAILMEPELKIDLLSLLANASQNTVVILLLDEPIQNNSLYNIDLTPIQYYQPDYLK